MRGSYDLRSVGGDMANESREAPSMPQQGC